MIPKEYKHVAIQLSFSKKTQKVKSVLTQLLRCIPEVTPDLLGPGKSLRV